MPCSLEILRGSQSSTPTKVIEFQGICSEGLSTVILSDAVLTVIWQVKWRQFLS